MATDIKYEVIKIADATAHASGNLGVIVLDTDQGRVGLHMKHSVFERLAHELTHALSREA